MSMRFHVSEGNDDFNAFVSLWPAKFGPLEHYPSAQHVIETAFRSGSAILARNSTNGEPVAATVLDFRSYGDALFVPFLIISDSAPNHGVAQRRVLELILRAFDASGVSRLLFVTDDSRAHRAAVVEFNEAGAKAGLPLTLKIVGQAEDLYGDGRNVIFHQLFITARERPDVTTQVTGGKKKAAAEPPDPDAAEPTIMALARPSSAGAAGIGAQILSGSLASGCCCSGCGEKCDSKDKEGKDGKEGKEGKEGIERLVPVGKLNMESTGVLEFYARIGIKRFNRYGGEAFTALV
jgi:hypothetical protein